MIKNYSYTYMLPLLSELVYLNKEVQDCIINTYMFTSKDSYIGKFYILCKYNYKDSNYSVIEDKLISNELFITSYDVKNLVLYEFKFPKIYNFEQLKFVNGEYSHFKKDSKKLILKFWTELYGHIPSFVTGNLMKIKQILYKEDKLRLKLEKELNESIDKNTELGNKICINKETFIFDDEKTKIKLTDLKELFRKDE